MNRKPDESGAELSSEIEQAQIFEELAGALRLQSLEPAQREALRARSLDAARAATPAGTATLRATEAAWLVLGPKVEMKILRRDPATRMQSVLLRVAAGGMIPAHRHTLEEEFIILEGECQVGTDRLIVGDVHIAAPGSWHDDITTQTGALVFVRGEIRSGAQA
jgi:anti-sigma factor ChrR (cupin superfamily)